MSFQKKKILVCPLNWGLGHATRDVTIIARLLDLGHELVIAADGAALELLKEEFSERKFPDQDSSDREVSVQSSPEQEISNPVFIRFPSFLRIRYSLFLPAWLKITLLSPLLLFEVLAEHFRLAGLIKKLNPDIIISDNRYGLWNRRTKSILITHQISLRLPRMARFLEYPAFLAMKVLITKFDHCWIPDYPGENNLSGDLSHRFRLPRNAIFIGAVTRLSEMTGRSSAEIKDLDLLIILSGPEPQRSRLQKIVLKQVFSLESTCVILQGKPGKYKRTDLTSVVTMYNHLPARELKKLLISAKNVICRSGYTGIMDLTLLQKKALLIPTPGQTEQEYLASYLAGKGFFLTCRQDELNLESAIRELSGFSPEFKTPEGDLLAGELDKL